MSRRPAALILVASLFLFLSPFIVRAHAVPPAAMARPQRAASTPGPSFVIPVGSPTPAPTKTPAARAAPTGTPTAVPTPPPSALLPPVYYQDGKRVYATYPDGHGTVVVATLPASATVAPQLLPDGRLLYPTDAAETSFTAVDRFGRASGIRTPDLDAGEVVWAVAPSPDGRSLAWQLFAPAALARYQVSTGLGRIALTGRFGGPGTTLFTTQADPRLGAVQALLGWRRASPYGSGGPTLLLQDIYGQADPADGVGLNTRRGLIEYDPAIGDIVNDYLPPLASDVPPRRALALSPDGGWVVYGDANAFIPSGEGPLARRVAALNLDTNRGVALDTATRYPTSQALTVTRRRKVGKRVVTTRVPAGSLRVYQYFSHNAYMAPDDGRVLYTLLTVGYPRGALVPQVRHSAMVAMMDGKGRKEIVSGDALGEGWLDAHTAVVARAGGLYAVNVDSGAGVKLAGGAPARLHYIGVRAK